MRVLSSAGDGGRAPTSRPIRPRHEAGPANGCDLIALMTLHNAIAVALDITMTHPPLPGRLKVGLIPAAQVARVVVPQQSLRKPREGKPMGEVDLAPCDHCGG